ncbi:MAG: MmoB/DmpM family protein [Myxococcales bacterium]
MKPETASEVLPPVAVGPVLTAGRVADAIVAAIQKENVGVQVTDRGSYLRVSVPDRCQVSRAAIEAALDQAQPFRLPGDLERVMPSFSGRFQVSEDAAAWVAQMGKSLRKS